MKRTVDNAALGNATALVVGASGRMVAAELLRQGIDCSVADLYGDFDTAQICGGRVHQLDRLSDLMDCESLVRAHRFIVFAGGLEGNLDVARKLARWSEPAYPEVSALRRINDVATFNQALLIAGLERYSLSRDPAAINFPAVAKDVTHSASAKLVHTPSECRSIESSNQILQEFVPGESVTQIYVADNGNVECLGGTLQLTKSLMWTGSISGLKLTQRDQESALKFAAALVDQSRFVGVFGIDLIRNQDGIWPVDVNPRIPASSEVVGGFVMQRHLKSFGIGCNGVSLKEPDLIFGKAVVFNRFDTPIQFDSARLKEFPFRHSADLWKVSVGDVPQHGEFIATGHPVLTVFASGETQLKVKSDLSTLRKEILDRLSRKKA